MPFHSVFDIYINGALASRIKRSLRLAVLGLICGSVLSAGDRPGDWTGDYPPCALRGEISKSGHLNLGIRFNTSVPEVRTAFVRAMDFWTTVLDMDWHEENSTN